MKTCSPFALFIFDEKKELLFFWKKKKKGKKEKEGCQHTWFRWLNIWDGWPIAFVANFQHIVSLAMLSFSWPVVGEKVKGFHWFLHSVTLNEGVGLEQDGQTNNQVCDLSLIHSLTLAEGQLRFGFFYQIVI